MKKSISFILVMLMVLCMIPGVALAAGDTWDGTADTSWYNPANPQTSYEISTAEQLAGLAELVSDSTTFNGVTFTLANDIDLYCEDTSAEADGDPVTFRPIGDHSKGGKFEGTFDGNGKTIFNLYQNGWDLGYEWGKYGSYGLFGNLKNATVKNLTLSGGESYIEGGDTSFVAGSATGTCVFENITIKDSISATYNNGNGGIIGWSGAGNYTFKNIKIGEDCVLAGLWGSFDSSIGGIVGQAEPGATYNFENVDIACRLDVYNDCTASYDYYNYRMCGMIMGRLEKTVTKNGKNYPDLEAYNITCKNVTVTYGDWARYHYCEPTPGHNGGRGMRVEPGYSYGGLPADFDHSQCTTNHMESIPFDQLFGGAQYGVDGQLSQDGVDVTYTPAHTTTPVVNYLRGDIDMKDEDIFTAVLTADEMDKSKPAEVWLEVNALDENDVVPDEKAAIEAVAAEDEIPIYMEINLYKLIGSDDAATNQKSTKTQITNLNKPITISLEIPEDKLMEGYTYYVIRVHNSEAERIDGKLEGNKLTFASDKFSTYALAYEETPAPAPAPKSTGSGISVTYNGGNSFSTSNSAVPTGVEIDGVPVSFNGNGSSFTVSGIPAGAKWITVRWNSTSVTTNFTPNGAYFAEVEIPKTGDMPFWAAIAEFFGF